MTRLVLISDLHFGRDDPELLAPLTRAIREAEPDLVLMGGDFTQRARASQFSKARRFMDGLGLPWIGVPGNHDIPLYNLILRAFDPYRGYRRWISPDLEPRVELPDAIVLGLDTTDPLAHQRGRISESAIRRIGDEIGRAGGRLPIVLAHHPFHHASPVRKQLMLGATRALEHWGERGPHVILSGHLHRWRFEPFVRREGDSMTLQLHCGTGLSHRLRGEANDFAILDCAGKEIAASRMVAVKGRFVFETAVKYQASDIGWRTLPCDDPQASGSPH